MKKKLLLMAAMCGALTTFAEGVGTETTVVFPFNDPSAPGTFTIEPAEVVAITPSFELGEKLYFNGTQRPFLEDGSQTDFVFAKVQPYEQVESATEGHTLTFTITPAEGYGFMPTSVYFGCERCGTDMTYLDAALITSVETVSVAHYLKPNRNKNTAGKYSEISSEIITLPAEGVTKLVISPYNCGTGKQICYGLITIKGVVYTTDETDAVGVSVMQKMLANLQTEVNAYLATDAMILLNETSSILSDAEMNSEDYNYADNLEDLQREYAALKEAYNQAKADVAAYQNMLAVVMAKETLMANYDYPGKEALQGVIDEAKTLGATHHSADFDAMVVKLNEAQVAYIFSQALPADVSLMVPSRNFRVEGEENVETANRTTEGWEWSVSGASGSDFGHRWNYGATCFNAWQNQAYAQDLHCDITVPDGVYEVYGALCVDGANRTDQHIYATSVCASVESRVYALDAAWDTLTTEKFAVINGSLRIGAASTNPTQNASDGWFCASGFGLKYYGMEGMDGLLQEQKTLAAELLAQVTLAADKKVLEVGIAEANKASTVSDALGILCPAVNTAKKSIGEVASFKTGAFAALEARIADEAFAGAKNILQGVIGVVNAIMAADTASYEDMATCISLVEGYMEYAILDLDAAAYVVGAEDYSANQIALLVSDKAAIAAEFVDGIYDIEVIRTYTKKMTDRLAAVHLTQKASETTDFTYLIVNPDCWANSDNQSVKGWLTKVVPNGNFTNNSEHWTGETNRYFNSWNATPGLLNFIASQKIEDIPNGTYRIKATVRSGDPDSTLVEKTVGACLFAYSGNDTVVAKMPITGNTGGGIWEAAEEGSALKAVNDGKGFGWTWMTLDVPVTDHSITFGATTDSTLTKVKFTGTWLGADDWQLFYIADGDNADWSPAVNVKEALAESLEIEVADRKIHVNKAHAAIYTVTGVRVAAGEQLLPGLYLVVSENECRKVLVK